MTKSSTTATRAIMFCLAAALSFSAIDAFAGNQSNAPRGIDLPLQKIVRYDDLDLSKIDGAKSLYGRLRAAAVQVCVPLESIENSWRRMHQACMDKAIADAVASVNNPVLSQYHQFRTKGVTAIRVQVAKLN